MKIKLNICLALSGLSINPAFTNNIFTNIFHSKESLLKVPTNSLLFPYYNQRVFGKSIRTKNANTYNIRINVVHPAGLEPATC